LLPSLFTNVMRVSPGGSVPAGVPESASDPQAASVAMAPARQMENAQRANRA